jgi:hypothetical protein
MPCSCLNENQSESGKFELCEECRLAEEEAAEFDPSEYTVTIHVSKDVKPETLEALGEMMKHLIKQIENGWQPPDRTGE